MSNKLKILIGLMGVAIAVLFLQVNTTRHELSLTQLGLTTTESKLNDTEGRLAATTTELEDTVSRLRGTEQKLATTQTELMTTVNQLTATANELNTTRMELYATKATLSSTSSQLAESQKNVTDLKTVLEQTQQKLTVAQSTLSGLGITLYSSAECTDVKLVDNPNATDPTFAQLLTFLAQDTTENHPYIANLYDCSEFSRDLHNRAEAAGIRCAEVQVWFSNSWSGHALNAFLTTDQGLVYVDCTEPPDRFARVKVFKVYRSLETNSVSAGVLRNDNWWDTLTYYYYIRATLGAEAITEKIFIYW